uniref:30S ribosomal protein S20 n=1 Tax=Vertebrata lanosa TaxID=1261582 RepID=A0A0B5W5S4_9FLOR|nr:30S ribosomal protein S20 [Vertebrata lanosa]AJH65966.1 30S ribosomal protein S20 [Vertebrata lanosa]
MPQTKSHIKNKKVILRNRNSNKRYKVAIKQSIKQYLASLRSIININNQENLSLCQKNLSTVYKEIDKAVNKNVLHQNTASRKKSRLSRLLK